MTDTPIKWSLHTQARSRTNVPGKVLVIGAGMAGLAAARILQATGFCVTILEARERIGGRTWTDDSLGFPCDLGASWIHGADDNPLTEWATAIGLQLVHTPTSRRRFFQQGNWLNQQDMLRTCWRGVATGAAQMVFAQWQSQQQRRQGGNSLSLAAAVDPILSSPALPFNDRRFLAWLISVSEGVQGAPAEVIDLAEWYPREATGVNAMLSGGYRQLVEDAAQDLDIRLGCAAGLVAYDKTGVTVHTQNGPFQADAVIITVPLSLLKSGRLLFDPPLPAAKQAAIVRIGFGGDAVLNKIFLHFPHRFWPDTQDRCVALPESPQERGFFSNWINLEPVADEPLLLGFASGNAAARLDREAGDEVIIDTALRSLRRMFGRHIPDISGYQITRWLSDPWAGGSYSYAHAGSRPADRALYAQPVADRLFFAGEGTIAADYGTVQAALLSGERAARTLHKRYCCEESTSAELPYAGWRKAHPYRADI